MRVFGSRKTVQDKLERYHLAKILSTYKLLIKKECTIGGVISLMILKCVI